MAAVAYGSGVVAILYREGRHGHTHEFEADAWAAAQGVSLTRELADHWQAQENARHTWRIPGWPDSHPSWAERYQHPANQAALTYTGATAQPFGGY